MRVDSSHNKIKELKILILILKDLKFPYNLWRNRQPWWKLSEREILGQYRGSILGITWSVITPLLMLGVYTFVFSEVFQARWGNGFEQTNSFEFAVNLFAGLIVFNLFAECVTRAPALVLANPSYVKKVVFPLEILAYITLSSAVFHALTSLSVLVIFQIICFHSLPVTFLWLPLVWMPLLLGCLALTWVLAALGVFLRDLGQAIGTAVTMAMFLSPIFYPTSALPLRWQPILNLNPLAQVITETRRVVISGSPPRIAFIVVGTVIAVCMCELAYRFFLKSKKAFADVV